MDKYRETKFGDLIRPHGSTQIRQLFGDIEQFARTGPDGRLRLDPGFERENIVTVRMPYALPLAGQPGECVNSIRCHRLLAARFESVFNRIFDEDLEYLLKSFGGCFNFRRKRNGRQFSTHAWGIAVDLNSETNLPGAPGDMPAEIVKVFKDSGFIWGGDWKNPDPMHFQYCTGY
jgi:hypothetical protein